jgi:hypothetical protein
MLALPVLLIGMKAYFFFKKVYDGGFYSSSGYPSGHPLNNFVKPQMSAWERLRIYVASVIHDLLHDPTIE